MSGLESYILIYAKARTTAMNRLKVVPVCRSLVVRCFVLVLFVYYLTTNESFLWINITCVSRESPQMHMECRLPCHARVN